jgi:hypothetical protein
VAEWKDTFGETQMKENDRGIPVKKVPVCDLSPYGWTLTHK